MHESPAYGPPASQTSCGGVGLGEGVGVGVGLGEGVGVGSGTSQLGPLKLMTSQRLAFVRLVRLSQLPALIDAETVPVGIFPATVNE